MVLPGRPGNLTPEEDAHLRELWQTVLRTFGSQDPNAAAAEPTSPTASTANERRESKTSDTTAADSQAGGRRKSRLGFLGWGKSKETKKPASEAASVDSGVAIAKVDDGNEKYGQTKEFKQALADFSKEDLRQAFWAMLKHDDPDGLLLRFLRARKWNVEAALVMMVSTMRWRMVDVHMDDEIMAKGEQPDDKDFRDQIKMGKAILHGGDLEGRPLCFVRVRLHRIGQYSEASLNRLIAYTIESARLLLQGETDTATLVFDMTNFSLANMDYTPVKVIIKCLEANYPESLAATLIHRAPWIFQGIWALIHGWLDPVVAEKVHFTKNADDLAKFIPRSQMPKECGGDEDWEWEYPEPVAGEDKLLEDTATRDSLKEKRMELAREYEAATWEWLTASKAETSENADAAKLRRTQIGEQLRQNYWNLDPYVRARSYLDRKGVIKKEGALEFYPKAEEVKASEEVKVEEEVKAPEAAEKTHDAEKTIPVQQSETPAQPVGAVAA